MTATDFKLERYKYILLQLSTLNENVHKYLLFYQTLVSAIIGGTAAFLVQAIEHNIPRKIVFGVLHSAALLLALIGAFTFLLVFSGIASWIDYRKEETELLSEVVNAGFRSTPRLRNFWRWPETYVLLFVTLGSIALCSLIRTLAVAITQ